MLDFWEEEARPGERRTFLVHVINDLEAAWSGQLRLAIRRGNDPAPVPARTVTARVEGWGR